MKKWLIGLSVIFSMNIAFATQESYQQKADIYWNEFETAYQKKQVRNISEWLSHLSTPVPEMTLENVQHNQRAIEYFLATGGRYGFAKRKATADEKLLCTKAIHFAAVSSGPAMSSSSSFLAWRDGLQLETTQASIKNHLAFVEIEYRAAKILKYGQIKVDISPISGTGTPYSVTAADTEYCRASLSSADNLIQGIGESVFHKGIVRLLKSKQWQESVKDINDQFYDNIYKDAPEGNKREYPEELRYGIYIEQEVDSSSNLGFASAVNNVFNKGTSFTSNRVLALHKISADGQPIQFLLSKEEPRIDFTLSERFQLKYGFALPASNYQAYHNNQPVGVPQADFKSAKDIYNKVFEKSKKGIFCIMKNGKPAWEVNFTRSGLIVKSYNSNSENGAAAAAEWAAECCAQSAMLIELFKK